MENAVSDAFIKHQRTSGLTVAEIAERSGVRQDTLYKVRAGKSKNMQVHEAVRVAQTFGMSVEDFMAFPTAQAKTELKA